jgi:hypothetical protein
MPLSLTLLLVLAGVVLLAFGIGSTGGAIRFLSGGAALLVSRRPPRRSACSGSGRRTTGRVTARECCS